MGANRDKNIIEEMERTKKRIELLEMKKQRNPSVEGALGKREKIALKKLTSADILSMDTKEESNEILRLMSLNATAREIYAENLMKVMRSELKMVVEHPDAGVFAPACYAHNDFDDVYIDGIDHHTALAWWVFKDSNVKLVDTC